MPNFTAFISYVLISNISPGPNTIISMSNASRYGLKKSIMFNFGILFGVIIIISLCNIFTVTLYSLIPSVKPVMSIIGASYILWLAWKTYKSKPQGEEETQKPTNTFLYGFLLQFVNPTVILYGLTTVSTFIVPYYKSPLVLCAFTMVLAFIGFLGTLCWTLFGSLFHKFFLKNHKAVNTVMALLLVYCGISLFL